MILGVIASNFLSRLLPNKQQKFNLFEDKLSALVKSHNPFVKGRVLWAWFACFKPNGFPIGQS